MTYVINFNISLTFIYFISVLCEWNFAVVVVYCTELLIITSFLANWTYDRSIRVWDYEIVQIKIVELTAASFTCNVVIYK